MNFIDGLLNGIFTTAPFGIFALVLLFFSKNYIHQTDFKVSFFAYLPMLLVTLAYEYYTYYSTGFGNILKYNWIAYNLSVIIGMNLFLYPLFICISATNEKKGKLVKISIIVSLMLLVGSLNDYNTSTGWNFFPAMELLIFLIYLLYSIYAVVKLYNKRKNK